MAGSPEQMQAAGASAGATFSGDRPLTMFAALRILFSGLSPRRRRALVPLIGLMLAGAVAEVVTIGALLPFLAVIANAEASPILTSIAPVFELFGAHETVQKIYLLTGIFALAAIIATGLRLLLLWASNSFIYGLSYELGVRLYRNVLHESYLFHSRQNTSEIIAAINKVQLVTNGVLTPMINAAVALVISTFIVAGLIFVDPAVALLAGAGFTAIYIASSFLTRARLRRNSGVISAAQGQRIKAMQEGLGGIRDVLIDQSQEVFIDSYEQAEAGYRDARLRNAFLAGAPRFLVEGAGMVLIACVAVAVSARPGGLTEAIPVLGALALGAQRLLPLIQQVYSGWATSTGNLQALLDVARLIDRPAPARIPPPAPLPFRNEIRVEGLCFSYAQDRKVALRDIGLTIAKGARIGIAGKTGSGKSTLMDILLGLLQPTAGTILVDGAPLTAQNRAAWQRNIAHVPQAIYLADASVAENIAFGIARQEIDLARVRYAAEQAELAEVIAGLPQGYETRVGERGIQLSGGQRQRIGIARALYKQANVLVFDEATSALDSETESAIMKAIGRLDRELTIFLIAHRLSTLEGCDMIVRLEDGQATVIAGLEPLQQMIAKHEPN